MAEKIIENENLKSKPPPKFNFRSTRMYIAFLLSFGIFSGTTMRIDMSMGIVCMVNSSFSDHAKPFTGLISNVSDDSAVGKCGQLTIEEATSSGYNGELEWTQKDIALLFSASFYGMLTTVWWSGWMADKIGPKLLFMAAVANSVFFTYLTPILAKTNFWAITGARFWMGVGEGFIMPCITSVGSRWFPPMERSTFAAIYTSGNQIGAVLTMPLSSYLCTSQFGWPSIFYVFGSLGCVWLICWHCFASNTPESNNYVSDTEKNYIHQSLGKMGSRKNSGPTPWFSIITSKPFLAAIIAQLSFSFSVILMQTYLPTFLKQVLRVPLKFNGFFAILPFVMQIITKNIVSNISDMMKKKKLLTNTQATKIFQLSGNIGVAGCFLFLAFFIDCDTVPLAGIILALFGCFVSCGIPGFFTALLSIAPRYTGTLTSLSLTVGVVGHACGPLLVGIFNKNGTKEEWRIIWIFAFILHCLSAIVFSFWGSAEIQEWAKIKNEDDIEAVKLKNIENDDNLLEEVPDDMSLAE